MGKIYNLFRNLLLPICFLAAISLQAEEKDLKKKLPQLLETANEGTEFLLTFHPGWGENSGTNAVRIFVTSAFKTEVRIIIPKLSSKPYLTKFTKKNDIIEFILPLDIAQPYIRSNEGARDELKESQVFEGRGIIVQSNDPVVVYAVSSFDGKGEGYLAMPVHALGKDYIVSGYQETATTTQKAYTPYCSIVAAYDNTMVFFVLGGNHFSKLKIPDGREYEPYEVIKATLNRGDVWVVAGVPSYGDLSGSKVIAYQPVSVISGNLCAKVPSNGIECNYLIEQELPKQAWGNKYFAIPIEGRKKSSLVRIFAKEPGTNIWRDGKQIAHLDSNYGIVKDGWFEVRANPDTAGAACYVGDKAIYAVQYNASTSDDYNSSSPFQMSLIPEEQFLNDFTYATPGLKSGGLFNENYINLIYRTDSDGQIPEDLEYGFVVDDSTTIWKKVKDLGTGLGTFIDDPYYVDSPQKTYSKTITLDKNGVYHFKCMTQAIGAYAYGFSKTEAAYAYPASMGYFDYERYDEFAPLVNYELDCEGNTYSTKTWVQDKPDIDSTCSRMAYITMNPELSKNYKLTVEPFIPGEKQVVKWGLKVIDPYLNAEAHLTFADRAGNLTRKVITYDPVLLTITPKNMNFGTFKIGENKTIQFTLKNESATRTIELTDLNLRSYNENLEETGFSLDYEFDFSEPLKPGDTRKFEVTFRAKTTGSFFDSIGVGNICLFNYKAVVKADVISEGIKIFVSDLDFGALQVGSVTTKSAIITNGGLDELKITGFTSTSPEFTTNLPKMSSTSPLIIPRDGSYQFNVTFRPTSERTLHDTISFISNAGSNIDPNCSLLAVVSGVDAYVMVLKPSTELQIEAGQVLYLEWKTSEVFPVDIKLFDGNSEERIIAINQLQLTYLWKIPKNLKASKDYKIRIIASYEPDIFGESPIIDINRIDELKYNPNISLSPNPTDGEVFIEANESEIIKEIALTDILGNKIMNWANIQKTSTLLDLSSVPNGKYFLRIRTEKGYKLKTIIVNR